MQASLTGDDVYAELLMLRTSDTRTIVLMESDADCSALDSHIDEASAQSIPGHSKSVVERAIELTDRNSLDRVLGILDRDWVGMIETPVASQNVVYSDWYDLDATIFFAGDVFDRVLSSLVDRDQCQSHSATVGATPKDLIVRVAGTVGVGRFVSVRDRLEASFDRFPVHHCIDPAAGSISTTQIGVIAVQRAPRAQVTETELTNRLENELQTHAGLESFCNGHDIGRVIAAFAMKAWGSGSISGATVEKMARAAFSCENLKGTKLYRAVQSWAERVGAVVWSCT